MKSINTGYKFIAIVSLSYALFSCSSSVESQLNSELLAKLTAIEAKIDTLTGTVDAVQTTDNLCPGWYVQPAGSNRP